MIQNSSMLVDLNISVWTGRKQDKKVSEEIDAAKSTKTKAGNYHTDPNPDSYSYPNTH